MGRLAKTKGSVLDRLGEKQQQFVREYLRCFNASEAARQAGYSNGTACSQGSRLLRNVKVAAALAEQLDKRGLTPERIKTVLAEVVFGSDIADFEDFLKGKVDLTKLREAGVNTQLVKAAAIHVTDQGGTIRKLEMYDRLGAIDKLIKVLGLVTEHRHISGHVALVEIDLSEMNDAELERLAHASGDDDLNVEGNAHPAGGKMGNGPQ